MLMGDSSEDFKEAVKTSFSKVRQHILELEKAIIESREFIIKQNEVILQLKEQIESLMNDLKDLKEGMAINSISSGNEGVINDDQQSSSTIINNHQQSSTIINNHQQSTLQQQIGPLEQDFEEIASEESIINDHQQSSTIINDPQRLDTKRPLSDVKKEIEGKFCALTDREFSVFMAIYQLEERQPDVNYSDVARMLKITEMTTRGYINSLISKRLPLEKKRIYNRKVTLGISREFRELNLASFLLTLRLPKTNFMPQKTLKGY